MTVKTTRAIAYGLFLVNILMFSYWVSRIHLYFFRSSFPDDLVLAISLFSGLFLGFFIRGKKLRWLFVALAVGLPWLLFMATERLVLWTNWGTIPLHVFLVSMGAFAVALVRQLSSFVITISLLGVLFWPYPFKEDQKKYYDRLELAFDSRMGEAQVVRWKEDLWVYYNGQLRYSTVDEHIWKEAYVQPALHLIGANSRVLLIGGDDGVIEDELQKFNGALELGVVPYDREFREWMIRKGLRDQSEKAQVFSTPIADVVKDSSAFDLIILDLPDPRNVDLMQYYSTGFFRRCLESMGPEGIFVTHAGDLYGQENLYTNVSSHLREAGFCVTPYHMQVPTIGHWSWLIGSTKSPDVKTQLAQVEPTVETIWWNKEAMQMMLSFGDVQLILSR